MLAPMLGMRQTYDISDEQARIDLSRVAVMVLSYAAQAARGLGLPIVPQREVDQGHTLAERFLIRWKGEPDPKHVKAIDAYWSSAAEHGMNASTFTARVITSTGADVAAAFSGAIGAMSGPLHGGAPSRVLHMIEEVEKRDGDAASYVKELLDKGERLMGFGHRVYRAEDPRARVLRRTARELNAPRYEVAEALEQAALAELRERRPDRVLETNVEFWAAIVLDFAEVPANMFTSMFTCARTGGWSAHILEQKRTGRLIRPSAVYVGPPSRPADSVDGWNADWAELSWAPEPPVLTTERLRLEPLTAEHAEHLVALDGDAEVMRYLTGRARSREEVLEEWLPALTARGRAGPAYSATGPGSREHERSSGWWALNPDPDDERQAELGYRPAPRPLGHGAWRARARSALLAHGSTTVGLERIWAQTMAVNDGLARRADPHRDALRAHLGGRVERAAARVGAGRGRVRGHPRRVGRGARGGPRPEDRLEDKTASNEFRCRLVDGPFGCHSPGRRPGRSGDAIPAPTPGPAFFGRIAG